MSYGRMKEQEVELAEKVKQLLAAAEATDREEDARIGRDKRGDEMPEDLRRAESRLAKIRAAKAELEAEALAAKELEEKEKQNPPDGSGGSELPSHRVPHLKDGTPTDKAQRNFTDPESRIQKTNDGFAQGFNGQAAVDEQSQVIVAQALTNQSPDAQHLAPMVELIERNCGALPEKLSADAGYFSEENVTTLERKKVDPYLATGRIKHGTTSVPEAAPSPAHTAKERMRDKLLTAIGRTEYAKRKWIVEPVFGQIKGARGLRQSLRRGIAAARSEWAFICTTHNLLKLFRAALPA
jgi:hypothetical protein